MLFIFYKGKREKIEKLERRILMKVSARKNEKHGIYIGKSNITFVSVLLMLLIQIFPAQTSGKEIIYYDYEIINSYLHDKEAFIQGLFYKDGYLYEGTGLKGKSSLRKVNLESGKIEKIHHLENKYFGEGITIFEDKIYQLTWKANTGFVYNLDFEIIDQFYYKTEGWGLTANSEELIMSDGSSKLYFFNPETFKKTREITVTKKGKEITNINELEYIEYKIYANIWQEDYIVIIDPESGRVSGIVDLEGLINPENYDYEINVLNGIAYDNKKERLFVTGKLWPRVFEIEIEKP